MSDEEAAERQRRDFADLVAAVTARITASLQLPTSVPGTVSEVIGSRDVAVYLDGTTTPIVAQNITGRPVSRSSRVQVVFFPPHQAFVLGTIEEVVYTQVPLSPMVDGGAELSGTPGTPFRAGTSSGSYQTLFRVDFLSVGEVISYDLFAYANGGDMDWRIQCCEQGGTLQTVVGPTNETGAPVQHTGTFDIPEAGLAAGQGNVIGRTITVRFDAKLNSGAPTADLAIIALTNDL